MYPSIYLSNIVSLCRGADVPCNPVAISYATITLTDAVLYVDGAKLSYDLISHLNSNQITIDSYDNILDGIAYSLKKGNLMVDSRTINYGIYSNINTQQRIDMPSPILLMKAIKNDVELQGMRNCHLRDGAAVVEFLCGLEKKIVNGVKVTEYEIDIELTASRSTQKDGYFVERSFPTIAGVNSNGAVIHYRAAEETCLDMTQKDMLLLDSGMLTYYMYIFIIYLLL
jgi:Xaa-Pro aminopeptidase